MGIFLSRGPTASEAKGEEEEASNPMASSTATSPSNAATVVKETVSENGKGGPTETRLRNERDGRSYKEALRGPENNSMSELQVPGPAWRFCETPEEQEMPLQECLP